MIHEQRVGELAAQIDASWPELPKGGRQPSFVTHFLRWHHARTDAPLIYGLAGALTLLATNAHPNLCLYLGKKVNANLWSVLVGVSGWSRKTTSLDLTQEIQEAVDTCRIGAWPGSLEGFDQQLANESHQTMWFDDFGDFLSETSGTGRMAPIRERMTNYYDGRTKRIQFKKTDLVVPDPRLSIHAGVTPAYLRDFTSATDWEGGFLGRMVLFFGHPERDLALPDRNPELRDWLIWRLTQLAATPCTTCEGLEDDALQLWKSFSKDLRRQGLSADEPWVASASARTQTFAAKFALLLALDAGINVSVPWKMPKYLLAPAIEIAMMYFASLEHVVGTMANSRYARERASVLRVFENELSKNRPVVQLKTIIQRVRPAMEKRDILRVLETMITEERVFFRFTTGRHSGDATKYSLLPPTDEEMAENTI